jgi:hypothetical protein
MCHLSSITCSFNTKVFFFNTKYEATRLGATVMVLFGKQLVNRSTDMEIISPEPMHNDDEWLNNHSGVSCPLIKIFG